MPLKKAAGNMYPWVTHVHTHLGGECPHKCSYCYVNSRRFGRPARYTGPVRLLEEELDVNYGSGRTIFIEHMTDLFAYGVNDFWIDDIFRHCVRYPNNRYVFQTKNPFRAASWSHEYPEMDVLFGVTIESDLIHNEAMGSFACPVPSLRVSGMRNILWPTFITIEPIMRFGPNLIPWICEIQPHFVNVGADSQGHNLPEPTGAEVRYLLDALRDKGIDVFEKANLLRLLEK